MKRLYLLLIPALLLATPSLAQERTGTDWVYLWRIFGVKPNGSLNPSADKLCADTYRSYEGFAVTNYKINPHTLIMSADTTFHGKTYKLHPLGLAGQYAFGYYQRHDPPIYGVIFGMNKEFLNPYNRIILLLNTSTNCVLTNLPAQ
jgi:hypothetical protein